MGSSFPLLFQIIAMLFVPTPRTLSGQRLVELQSRLLAPLDVGHEPFAAAVPGFGSPCHQEHVNWREYC
jgi:hypothetical protein